jgi:hypothetical protein
MNKLPLMALASTVVLSAGDHRTIPLSHYPTAVAITAFIHRERRDFFIYIYIERERERERVVRDTIGGGGGVGNNNFFDLKGPRHCPLVLLLRVRLEFRVN